MSDADATWDGLAAGYVRKVEKALSAVDYPRKEEVLRDLRAHLQQRYDELAPEERTPARLSTLIKEMDASGERGGPPAPAEQAGKAPLTWREGWRVGRWALAAAGLVLVVVAAVRPHEAMTPIVFVGAVTQLALLTALALRYARTRDAGLLWLAAAVVALPVLAFTLSRVYSGQMDNLLSRRGTVWLWPLTAVKHSRLSLGESTMIIAYVQHFVRDGLILVALLKLRLAPRAGVQSS